MRMSLWATVGMSLELKQILEEERAATQQERTATEQQVRAYKRQVDGLNEQLTEIKEKNEEIKEKNEVLQKSLNTKNGLEIEIIDLQQQIYTLKETENKLTSLLHDKFIRESELENELDKMNKGNKVLKEKNNTISRELENTEEACRILLRKLVTEQDNNHRNTHAAMENMRIAMIRDMENMRNANMILQQRLKDAWVQVDQLQDEICTLIIKSKNKSASTLDQGVPGPASNQPFDSIASDNVNIYESTYHSPNQLGGEMQRPQIDFLSQSNHTQSSNRERSNVPPVHPALGREKLAGDIKENPILQNIDREIEHVADNIRRQILPPQTQEFLNDDNDDPSLGPYDPNLVCQGCGMRYHYGEIQKLRRHVNEFCVARQYTQTIQPKHIIEYNDDDNIDKEIQQVAAEVRRVSQPPRTQEFLNDDNDDPSLGPYDPNLTCNGCGMRYRYGEIQKLRRHINEFCVSLKYTENQQPRDNDRV